MTLARLVPVLLLKHGVIVRSQNFTLHQVFGNPMSTVERFSNWNVDELIVLDISRGEDFHDLRRDDLFQNYSGTGALDVLSEIAKVSFMPLAFGGRVKTLSDISERLERGADKVVINTAAFDDRAFIAAAARRFGSQCIVVSIDGKKMPDGHWRAFVDGGRRDTGLSPAELAARAQADGAGEIFLNSIDRDGAAKGYDLEMIRAVTAAVTLPVIACGGVGAYGDFSSAIRDGGAAAAAAANIFHFAELSYPLAKQRAIDDGVKLRPVELGSRYFPREPDYDPARIKERLETRRNQARTHDYPAAKTDAAKRHRPIRWCRACVYPSASAAPMEFDESGLCTGCQMAVIKREMPQSEWDRRLVLLKELVDQYRSKDGSRHDCVIAVSGGKDSYFQTHMLKYELGLNPLLVTYDANNWTPAGWRNLLRMKDVFDCDHVVVSPAVGTLKKLNRLGFEVMGDMNWHAHVGIMTVPMQVAVERQIPLVFYGEQGYLDLCGMFSMDDFPEHNFRDRLEHFGRGYEWSYFVGLEGLSAGDMMPWRYPSDRHIFDLGLRGVFLGNYVYWEANDHAPLMQKLYSFEVNDTPPDRTYRLISNLDDMHENGAHDYLKYIKFGYGRATDHVCKDIRAGLMTREEGIRLVHRYDPVKPRDLQRWLAYTGMSEDEFDRIADTFRDPRVWRMVDGAWVRDRLPDPPEG